MSSEYSCSGSKSPQTYVCNKSSTLILVSLTAKPASTNSGPKVSIPRRYFQALAKRPTPPFGNALRSTPAINLGRDDRGESLGRQHLAHLRAGGRGPVEREHAATVPDAVLVDVGLELLEEHRLAITQNHSAPQLRQRDAHESDAGAELQHRPGAQAGLVPAAAGAAAKRGEPTHQQQGTGPDAAAGQQAAIQVVGAGRPAAAPHANLQRRDPGVTDEPDLVSRCAPRPILLTVCCPVYARDVPLLLPNVTIDLDFGQALLQLPLDVLQRRRRLLVGRAATEDEGEFRAYQQLVASHLGPQHEVVEDR
mmetsp:Transcript_18105/g.51600  ORF Transcript_18105/g.51600 Transcript_18105/m.51600 type:complete len:308 (+) Transcript_18105:257-1180(+)